MAEISWTDEAQRWLNDIFEYIAADNPQAAARSEDFPNSALVTQPHRATYVYCSTDGARPSEGALW
jgi:hypothetical protein